MDWLDDIAKVANPVAWFSTNAATGGEFSNNLNAATGGNKGPGGFDPNSDEARRARALEYGQSVGQKEFYDDPDMQRLRALREDYAKGYSGEVGGAIRQQARGEIAGNQNTQARKLASGLGKGGVGGSRGAAVQAYGARESGKAAAEAERKMAIDSYQMQKQGAADLQDFIFRQKYGKVGLGAAFAGLASSDYAAQKAAEANNKEDKGFFSFLGL